mmetsp:Transcript_4791/g.10563  ORF Transcript_4791/g.10563 Transcript_4791/m.10563 type:complete len:267 (-) Transcript_4791:4517-5317(-)
MISEELCAKNVTAISLNRDVIKTLSALMSSLFSPLGSNVDILTPFEGKRNPLSPIIGINPTFGTLTWRSTFKKSMLSKDPFMHNGSNMTVFAGNMPEPMGSGIFSLSCESSGARRNWVISAVQDASLFSQSYRIRQQHWTGLAGSKLFTALILSSRSVMEANPVNNCGTSSCITSELKVRGIWMTGCILIHMSACCNISTVMPFSVTTSRPSPMMSSSCSMKLSSGMSELAIATAAAWTCLRYASHISPKHHGRVKISVVTTTTKV